ncbi:MAG: glycoside hydrolase family 28 protein [Firmicutes bacterium]|nr:glycoside hydrolase family 28 protein [Bacillota bacterium]
MAIYNITEFGAKNDGKTLCSDAIAKAVAECEKNGGGTVFVPAGTYKTGPVFLKSNIELNLESGAILLFSDDPEDFPVVTSRWEGVKRECYASCINADNAENISITGRGTIDGNGANWWKIFRAKENKYPRPKLIAPYESNNILIDCVTLKNSPSWTINTILCDNITVNNVTIKNPYDSPNTDGIDPESCSNIHISNCHIDVCDDCIAIKAGTEDTKDRVPCRNITITNCTMVHGHGGVVLGSEMSGDITNVTISNCIFEGTDRGIRLKSRRGRGGVVEDIRVNNIVMNNVFCPFIANLYYFCGPKGDEKYVWDKAPYPITEETPAFRRLNFANITAKNVNAAAGYFYGLAEMFVEDCSFDNVYISMKDDAVPAEPAMLAGIEKMKQKGFFASNTRGIVFNNVKVVGVDGPAFEVENSEDITFSNCKNIAPRNEDTLVKQTNVKNCVIK